MGLFALMLGLSTIAARAGGVFPGAAAVHVMVFPAAMFPVASSQHAGEDRVTFTYSTAVPDAKVLEDSSSFSKLTSRTLHDLQISTDAMPVSGQKAVPTTCAVFSTASLLPVASGGFEIEPLICALKGYKQLRMSFIEPTPFHFTGLRDYNDRYVKIRLAQVPTSGATTYTYDIAVKDASFQRLGLPVWQADPDQARLARQAVGHRNGLLLKVAGLVLVALLAAAAGYVAYSLFAAKVRDT